MRAKVEAAHTNAGHSKNLHFAITKILAEKEQLSVQQLRHEHEQLQEDLQEAIRKKAELTAKLAELVSTAMSCRPSHASLLFLFQFFASALFGSSGVPFMCSPQGRQLKVLVLGVPVVVSS